MYFAKYCANDKMISLGPRKSIETYISKNNSFHDEKRLQPFLPRFIESDRHQKNKLIGSKSYFDIYRATAKIIF